MNQIIKIGKKSFITGMRWFNYVEKPSKNDILEDAERAEANWYAVRDGAAIQCGFCASVSAKIPSKLESLAARVAEAQIQPWMGIFEISAEEDLYWYIAVRDQYTVLADGDIIGSKEEVLAVQQQHKSFDDWQYVDGDLNTLQELLQNDKAQKAKPTLVKVLKNQTPLTPFQKIMTLILTFAFFAVAGGGYWWYQAAADAEAARLIQQKRQAQQKAGEMAVADAIRLAMLPLFNLPLPEDFLSSCRSVLYSAPVSENGWLMNGFSCSPEAATISRKRAEGASVGLLPEASIPDTNGEQTTQTYAAKKTTARRELPPLIAFNEAALILRDFAQRAGLTLSISAPASIMSKPEPQSEAAAITSSLPGIGELLKDEEAAPKLLPYVHATFSFVVHFAPFELQFNVPGLFIKSIKTTADGYTVEGVIYGKR